MINIDFLTLKAFLVENIDFLIGARLQKVQQPSRREFVLSLRNNSESRKLYININPQIYHIAFIETDMRPIVFPKQPPMFCMLLRKYLEGCKVSDAVVMENERILELHFETYDELSQRRQLCLCVELMGKHSNVILYDRESSIIIGCAHNVGAEKSRYRELQGGLKYIYPPKTSLTLTPTLSLGEGVRLSRELEEQFKGLSQDRVGEYLRTETFRPAIAGERYTLFSELLPGSIPKKTVNSMLDEYYSKYQTEMILKSEKDKLISNISIRAKKVKSSMDKILALLKKRDKTDEYKLLGELLTANLYQKKDYQREIEVFDYVNGQNLKIELDETKTLNENAQRYFKLYTKSKTTKEKSAKILDGLKIENEYLENILYSINAASNLEEIAEIKLELEPEKQTSKKEVSSLLKLNIQGFDVYIGKNNKQNDYIISKLSKDEDYWFHTRLCAGSHVLLKVQEREPDEAVLFECCKLARTYSSAMQPSKVGIIYTKRKFIKKPPGAPLGYVIYKNEKEVLV